MIFNSVSFGIFFPIAVIIYFLIPSSLKRARLVFLFLASLYFYVCQGAGYALLLLFTIIITYVAALFLKGNKIVFIAALILDLLALLVFKYLGFFCDLLGVDPGFRLLLPVGISFYVFKSASYLIDVYRGDLKPEKDFFKYALYVSFFPEILAGPISRAPSMLHQFDEEHTFDYDRIRDGLFRMLWGYFIKLTIASRLAITVDMIYGNIPEYDGLHFLIAALLYSVQIYCDFMSYSEIAIGAAKVLGIETSENFKQPFLARSLSEVWRRWHMSLMSWFKDYLYIPLGGSRKGRLRKYLNVLIVFTLSGLWHGAAVTYILWGFLSGLLQVIGEATLNIRAGILSAIPFKGAVASRIHTWYSRTMTFLLFSFTAVFFRSPDVPSAFAVLKKIFTETDPGAFANFNPTALGLGTLNLMIAVFLLFVLILSEVLKERRGETIGFITKEPLIIRWGVYFFLVCSIIGSANIGAAKFIYFEF